MPPIEGSKTPQSPTSIGMAEGECVCALRSTVMRASAYEDVTFAEAVFARKIWCVSRVSGFTGLVEVKCFPRQLLRIASRIYMLRFGLPHLNTATKQLFRGAPKRSSRASADGIGAQRSSWLMRMRQELQGLTGT